MNKSTQNFLIGTIIIISGTSLMWFPFFNYVPVAALFSDSPEYYNILSGIEQRITHYIGYPQIGYPIFLKICELIINKLWFVVFMQVILNLSAVLLLYYAYFKVYGKYLIPIAFLFMGFLTSDLNLYLDSQIYPDSLLLFFNILSVGLTILIVGKKQYKLIPLLAISVVYAIAIRPSALILFPLFISLLFFLYRIGTNKLMLIKQLIFFVFTLLLLCTVNYVTPGYGKFNIITFPIGVAYQYRTPVYKVLNNNAELYQLDEFTNIPDIALLKTYDKTKSLDSIYTLNRLYFQRGVHLRLHERDTTLIYRASSYQDFILDSLYTNKEKFSEYKKKFMLTNTTKTIEYYSQEKNLQIKWNFFVYFFKYFYIDGSKHYDIENRDFYSQWFKYRWGYFFIEYIWQKDRITDARLNGREVATRTSKELTTSKPKTKKEQEEVFSKLENSFSYKYLVKPYYKIHQYLFRNFLYPIIFIISFLFSIVGLIISRFKSGLFYIVFITSSLLMLTNLLHSFHLLGLHLRYTYQVSFVYYVALIFLPLMIESFWQYKKTGSFKY